MVLGVKQAMPPQALAYLINRYFATRHDPLLPRSFGAAINIAFSILFLQTIRKLLRRLKQQ